MMIDDEESPFISISDEEYAEMQAKVREGNSLDFHGRYAKASDWRLKQLVVQDAYKHFLPSIIEAAKTGHSIDPNIVTWKFSLVEDAAWYQIRALGLPLYPQFPILDYFADFADPFRKIVVEVNRSKPQNKKSDNLREKLMREAGWKVHRINGRTLMRYLQPSFSADIAREIEENINSDHLFLEENKFYLEMAESTLDGYFLILRRIYYTKNFNKKAPY
jgi:very-short-patch-repair endonuclease